MNPLSTGRRRVLAMTAAMTGAILPLLLLAPSPVTPVVQARVTPQGAPDAVDSFVEAPRRISASYPRRRHAPDLAPRTPHEEAMLSAIAHSGEGFLRCELPSGMTPDLDALNWAGLQGTTLTMAAEEPSGSILLRHGDVPPPPRFDIDVGLGETEARAAIEQARLEREAWDEEYQRPIGVAEWTGAGPGQEGRCTVHTRDDQVLVQVYVRDAEGQPVPHANLTTYGPSTKTDAQGRASVKLWAGGYASLYGYADIWDDGGDEGLPSVRALTGSASLELADGNRVDLVLRDRQLALGGLDGVDSTGFLDEAEARLEDHDAYVMAALREPGLSEHAKAQLTYWLDRSQGDADALYAVFRD